MKKYRNKKNQKKERAKKKIRSKISGTAERPRLSVFRSNKFIYVQAIDDSVGRTIAEADDKKIIQQKKSSKKTERAIEVGKDIAKKLLDKKIDKVVFDRNRFKYTGRIKALAESARGSGLKF